MGCMFYSLPSSNRFHLFSASLKKKKGARFMLEAMRCFPCSNIGRRDEPRTTIRSNSTTSFTSSTDHHDAERAVSCDYGSLTVSDTSTESSVRILSACFSQRASNLRVFTYAELKMATRNFSRSVMIGEGGFGCVYKGVISDDDEDPDKKIDIAVKQLSRRGLQMSVF